MIELMRTRTHSQSYDYSLSNYFFRRNLDKLKRDLSELVPESKKPRIHSPARSSPGLAPRYDMKSSKWQGLTLGGHF